MTMGKLLEYIVLGLALTCVCECYHILVVFPFPSKSHSILGDGVVRHLLAAKHEVTYITAFPQLNTPANLHQVDVSAVADSFPHILDLKSIMDKKVNMHDQHMISMMMLRIISSVFEQKNMKLLLDDTSKKFDAVVAEWMFSEAYGGIAQIFEAPLIWLFPFEHAPIVLSLIDEAPNPAYTTNIYLKSDVPPFSFVQRLKALYTQSLIYYNKFHVYSSDEEELYKTALSERFSKRGRPLPPWNDVRYNISAVLVNCHISLGSSLRLPPNYINIGGYHIDNDVKPLPQDLQKIMDEAKHGVIYFSMGSNLKSKELPDDIKRGLLKMFGELKQIVLWKFEEAMQDKPKNVHILNWAPQPSILAHPNCLMFITHGGLLSTTETVHFGKPIIGIPVFADQFLNVDKAVSKGYAKRVDLTYDVVSDLRVAIDDILTDSRYAEKASQLSAIYHDRPVSPGAELVHWVEHVVRTRGAPHLRSPALWVPLYQKLYLDLIGMLVGGLYLFWTLIKKLLCSNSKPTKTNNQSKKKK